ncbi:MAG: hypothetical protein IKN63_05490 [Bacilli bacterium]|nr:hypothetical protein [Bacilli bacterium]
MKKYLNILFTLILLIFSFYYTNIVSSYIKKNDPIMQQILENCQEFESPSIDAIIENNTIIPGKSSRKVDINKSYKNMKRAHKYITSLYIYEQEKPTISLNNQYDKLIISGNKSTKNISILVNINDINILKKLKDNSLNLILDINFINDNLDYLTSITNNIIVLEQPNLTNLNIIDYCYSINTFKAYCKNYYKYTIKPILFSNDYFYNTYNSLENGVILSYYINDNDDINNLNTIISYLKSLKYNIVSIDELIKE